MKKLLFSSLQTFLFCGMLLACVGSLQLTVLYDSTEGLKQNDPVLWNELKIGKVQSVKQNSHSPSQDSPSAIMFRRGHNQ